MPLSIEGLQRQAIMLHRHTFIRSLPPLSPPTAAVFGIHVCQIGEKPPQESCKWHMRSRCQCEVQSRTIVQRHRRRGDTLLLGCADAAQPRSISARSVKTRDSTDSTKRENRPPPLFSHHYPTPSPPIHSLFPQLTLTRTLLKTRTCEETVPRKEHVDSLSLRSRPSLSSQRRSGDIANVHVRLLSENSSSCLLSRRHGIKQEQLSVKSTIVRQNKRDLADLAIARGLATRICPNQERTALALNSRRLYCKTEDYSL
ncbi:hypothetical protein B0O80DRAFT_457782, partial [Mortierella sp. GBAus27b]